MDTQTVKKDGRFAKGLTPWNKGIKSGHTYQNISGLSLGRAWNKGLNGLPQLSGKNHWNYKGLPKPLCSNCGKIVSNKKVKTCWDCFVIFNRGVNTRQYKGGKPKCLDCGTITTQYTSKRCVRCYQIFSVKENNPAWKGKLMEKVCNVCNLNYSTRTDQKHCSMKCANLDNRGIKHHAYKGDNAKRKLQKMVRGLPEYKIYRASAFERDLYTCLDCGAKGVYLNAHHIKPLAFLIEVNNIKNSEDARNCKELWDLNNLKTICLSCHEKTDSYLSNYRKNYILKNG